MPDLHGWISQQIDRVQHAAEGDAPDPWAAVALRRCAADRKILEIHKYHGGSYDVLACTGCGYDDMGYLVDHVNDCETLQAIADGYGITGEELAQLDRPQQPSRQEASMRPQWDACPMGTLRCLTTPTTAVPAALRGPNWKAKP